MADQGPASTDELRLHLLVLRCQTGDERAFAQVMEWFGPRTLRYLRGLVQDAAEDIQQEVWLAVFLGIRTLTNPRAFRTWLFRTTRHRAIDFLRRQRREKELLVDDAGDVDQVVADADDGAGIVDSAALEAALAGLPAVQREAMLLRYRDDLSYAEIALVAGCSIGTVRSRLHHAKRRIEEWMEQRR